MRTALIEMAIQTLIIVALWTATARHAASVRARTGTSPGAISPFAWGALVGLTGVAAVPYLIKARRPAPTGPERDLVTWWPVLALGAAAWTAANAAAHHSSDLIQHAVLTAIILGVWVSALRRRSTHRATSAMVST